MHEIRVSPRPPLPAIARSFVIALSYLLCPPRLPPTILLRSDLPENALQSQSSWFHILSIYRCRMDGREKKVVLVRPCSRSVRDHCMAQSTYPFRPARREEMEPRKLNKCRSSRCGANPGLPHAACIQTATQLRRGGSGTSGKHVCA